MNERTIPRRRFLQTSGWSAVALAAAPALGLAIGCAPGIGAPQPEAGVGTGPRQPWEEEWDKLVAAAKGEGVVVVNTFVGDSYRKPLDAFEKAFPGITVEHSTFGTGSIFAPKAIQEREAGIYTWDVNHVAPSTSLSTLLRAGAWDPVRGYVFPRPDVVDDANWIGSFEWGFVGPERRYQYVFAWAKRLPFWIDTRQVREDEIKSVRDLLNPKWKGKILMADVRTGDTFIPMTGIRLKVGDDVIKQLMVDQQPVFSRDYRQMAEQMVRGSYAICNGIRLPVLKEFLDEGLGKNLKNIAVEEAVDIQIDHVNVFNKAPHPNAAKLYVTWLLTKEGQAAWQQAQTLRNSRRRDVPVFDPNTQLKDGEEKIYPALDLELDAVDATQKLLNSLVR